METAYFYNNIIVFSMSLSNFYMLKKIYFGILVKYYNLGFYGMIHKI